MNEVYRAWYDENIKEECKCYALYSDYEEAWNASEKAR